MPRKKIVSSIPEDKPVKKFVPRDGRMIANEVMYSTPALTDVIGVVMSGDIVLILDIMYDKNLAYIKTKDTNRIGYVNSKSVL